MKKCVTEFSSVRNFRLIIGTQMADLSEYEINCSPNQSRYEKSRILHLLPLQKPELCIVIEVLVKKIFQRQIIKPFTANDVFAKIISKIKRRANKARVPSNCSIQIIPILQDFKWCRWIWAELNPTVTEILTHPS